MWAVLDRFGLPFGWEEFLGKNIHCIENVLTLEFNVHCFFDNLDLWLESTVSVHDWVYLYRGSQSLHDQGIPHQYHVRTTPVASTSAPNQPITLPSHPDIPSPDSRLLKLHAVYCRVAHLSGAGESIDKIHRDMKDTRVLAEDGSSIDLLSYRLATLQTDEVTFKT